MKTLSRNLLLPALTGAIAFSAAGVAQAQDERGRVISSTPVIQQVAVPREVCENVQVRERARSSGAGALMGGIAGGAMGNAVGGGTGRAVATALGIFGGAVLGDRIEGRGQSTVRTVQECTTQNVYENQTVAYNVVYEYAGRQYSVEMDDEPGRYVPVSVQPVNVRPVTRPQVQYVPASAAPEVVYVGRIPRGHSNGRWDREQDDRWDRNWR
ncbi:hypothetical protein LPB72_12705 [Hydrogenophaga crassostreae]|uniref:Glycine zipper 2TM domain-containing protein n=1 Tax=Hydrogenophaga crassostreae TaxID=1763535 RepID=A0A167HNM2_9BURK|nr:hypothetical protein [Hydrogenophaga crassostreae]AOW14933.1 hypothetical protein LPB072_21035 [Hydrogenophaga crassostreae]OAD41500.1 hypothetical protein LPB72_12705 [Hydrogenophaga crassostreae]